MLRLKRSGTSQFLIATVKQIVMLALYINSLSLGCGGWSVCISSLLMYLIWLVDVFIFYLFHLFMPNNIMLLLPASWAILARPKSSITLSWAGLYENLIKSITALGDPIHLACSCIVLQDELQVLLGRIKVGNNFSSKILTPRVLFPFP